MGGYFATTGVRSEILYWAHPFGRRLFGFGESLSGLSHGTGFAPDPPVKLHHLDAVRGVAILGVVLVHAAQAHGLTGTPFDLLARYGQMGVQLFFVASAYTLCLSAERRAGESRALLKYGLRRLFRIAPLYYLAIGLYYLQARGGYFADNPHVPTAADYTPLNVLANVLLLHGSYPPANNVIVPGGWSIGTEVAFYAAFPLLWSVVRRARGRDTGVLMLIFVLAAVTLSQATLLCLYPLGAQVHNGGFWYFHLVTQAPVFCIGIAYYVLRREGWGRWGVGYDLGALATLTLLALGLWSLYVGHLYSVIATVSGLSFVALVEALRKLPRLSPAWLRRLGQASYSVYVLHFLVVWGLSSYAGAALAGAIGAVASVLAVFVLGTLGSFAAATLTERLVEQPFVRLGRRLIARLDARAAVAKTGGRRGGRARAAGELGGDAPAP